MAGDQILNIENLSFTLEGVRLFDKIDLNIAKGDKVVIFSKDSIATTAFSEIINSSENKFSGKIDWGITTSQSYLPIENHDFFTKDLILI